MNTINRFAATMISFIVLVSLSHSQPSPDYLSGYVYNGNQGDETNPISGVTVTLYGASSIDQLGSQITSTITNSSGHYSLSAPSGYEYYSILEVTREASGDEIKHSYRRLALQFHPDRTHGDPETEERFKEINEAYAVLSDPEKRRTYDITGSGDVH